MRRKDREITDSAKILEILDSCSVIRLALCKDNMPYIVPLNFGYRFRDNALTLYFHCASQGKKLDIMRVNSNAAFEADCGHKLISGEKACDYSYSYQSIIGFGKLEEISEIQEKAEALNALMLHLTKKNFSFTIKELNHVTLLKLCVEKLSGKAKA